MLNIGGGEFLIILLVALVVLGPTKLPDAARQVGKVVGEFRRISAGFQREIQTAMNDPVSKVTGEATPKTLKDVTTVAEPPPVVPTQISSAAPRPQDVKPKPGEADPAEASASASDSIDESAVRDSIDTDASTSDAVEPTPENGPDQSPEPPIMYGDR